MLARFYADLHASGADDDEVDHALEEGIALVAWYHSEWADRSDGQDGVMHDSTLENFDLGMVCGRCSRKTGNLTQGHYWSWCKVVRRYIGHHFCCPEDCELEGATPIRPVLTVRPGHIASECPDLIDCAAHTDWHLAWREREAP